MACMLYPVDQKTDMIQLLFGLFVIHVAIDAYKEAKGEP